MARAGIDWQLAFWSSPLRLPVARNLYAMSMVGRDRQLLGYVWRLMNYSSQLPVRWAEARDWLL